MTLRQRPFAFATVACMVAMLAACGHINSLYGTGKPHPIPRGQQSRQAMAYGQYLSGHLAASNHDLSAAAMFYRDALAHAPQNEEILARAFLFTAASGDMAQAAKLATQVIARDPNDRTARLALAVDDLARSNYAGARTQIAQSARGPFTSLTLTLLDAWAAEGLGRTDLALKDLAQVTEQGGTRALALYHSALILSLAGKIQQADKDFAGALAASGPTPRQVEAYGRFLERDVSAARASAFYAKFAKVPSLEGIVQQARARIAAGKKPQLLIETPQQGAAEALFGIAASLTDRSSADVAILYLRFALALAPRLDLAKIVLADRFEALHKWQLAIDTYHSVSATSPYKNAASIEAAIDRTRIGQSDLAVAELTAITKVDASSVTAWTALGDALRNEKKYAQATVAYTRALAAVAVPSANEWPLYYARAICEQQTKDWPAAQADLKRALALSPNQPDVLNFLGYSWVDRGERLAKALAMLEKARALSPLDGYIVDSVGWAYYRLGRYKDAAAALAQAVELQPGDATINDHYGDALWRVGRELQARFQWNHALTFGARGKERQLIENKLLYGLPRGTKAARKKER
jgi:tetratricopeptide (TPR) repeat protein